MLRAAPQTAPGRPDAGRRGAGRSAACDGGDDRERLTCRERGVEAGEEADVLIVHEEVDEAPQLALFVEEALTDAGVGHLECVDRLADGGGLKCDLTGTAGEAAQLGRNP